MNRHSCMSRGMGLSKRVLLTRKRSLSSPSKRLTLTSFLAEYPTISPLPVKWGDMDAFKHVNNTVYFKYQEEGRICHMREMVEALTDDADEASKQFTEGGKIGPILKHTECSYKFPTTYPDDLLVGTRTDLATMTASTFVMHYVIWSRLHQRPVSEGTGTVVAYDYGKGKPTDLPKAFVDAIHRLHADTSKNLALEDKYSTIGD